MVRIALVSRLNVCARVCACLLYGEMKQLEENFGLKGENWKTFVIGIDLLFLEFPFFETTRNYCLMGNHSFAFRSPSSQTPRINLCVRGQLFGPVLVSTYSHRSSAYSPISPTAHTHTHTQSFPFQYRYVFSLIY